MSEKSEIWEKERKNLAFWRCIQYNLGEEREDAAISAENDAFYCRPSKKNVITKLAFATEEIYLKSMKGRKTAAEV